MYDTSLHRLRVFKLVVETGGIGTAATVLGISQPAVSAHIRILEALVGQPLLSRRPGQKGELTDAGNVLYSYAHDVIVGADNVLAVLHDLDEGLRGRVSFAASRTLGDSVLAPILTDFHALYTGTRITLRTGTLSEITQFISTGSSSFGIIITSGPISSLHSEFLRSEPRALLASPAHRLAMQADIGPDDLRDESFVIGLRDSLNFLASATVLREVGFAYDKVVVETNDYVTLKALVAQGCGIAVMPRSSAQPELDSGELVELHTSFAMPPFELRLAYLSTHRFTPTEHHLVQLIRDVLSQSSLEALASSNR